MHKITGSARLGWEKMSPAALGMRNPISNPNHMNPDHPSAPPALKRPMAGHPLTPTVPLDTTVNLSFNVPFSSNLAGPDPDDILHASPGGIDRWLHPEGTPDGTPTHKLPVHAANVEALRKLCRGISETESDSGSGSTIEATVTSSEPKALPALQRRPMKGLVTNVCLSGDADTVHQFRARILNETPVALRCAIVDLDTDIIIENDNVKSSVLEHLDTIAAYTGTDIFLLGPRLTDPDTAGSHFNGSPDTGLDHRLRAAVYGDMESAEHAKTRTLIMVDQILKRTVDAMKVDLSLHTMICGRSRKHIKLIESATDTAIYFPPPFPHVYGYTPPGAHRRSEDEVFITGAKAENIAQAKAKLQELVLSSKCYLKDVMVSSNKIDGILLDRMDKVRKITENNGSFILFPQLGTQRGFVRVQATEISHVERTVKDLMALAGQFYSATWWILVPDPASAGSAAMRAPSPADVRTMLSDICTNSGADVSFDRFTFTINGSDDAVKAAMMVIHQIPFVKRARYQMRVKIELANEHKEFVSGKKNGKINKIMGQSNVQIIFDGFNEYNFYIDVCGGQYEATRNGLDLVEQEMPASIAFHVPDQYHKRIIGIGGQHIQRIMKRYSVFVKFSNALERGTAGREDDDLKVDNVICRTPARNAQNLDLVKQEIMDMVEKADAESVQETVVINRLYHRELIARMKELEALERKWNCKIIFPSTEMASDVVTVSGPEYQVPQAVDEFLGMVPESHELVFPRSKGLSDFLRSAAFETEVHAKLRAQYEVDTHVNGDAKSRPHSSSQPLPREDPGIPTESILLTYTRNNAGALKDAIDCLISRLVAKGLDATTIKGNIPRPVSDSFEDNLHHFDSKLLQHAPAPLTTDSPTRSHFGLTDPPNGDRIPERSIFEKLRKPGSISSISSFLERRKNHSNSSASFFKNNSSNGSRASLVSIESRDSAYRNPWNDSGVNLAEEGSTQTADSAHPTWPARHLDQSKFPFAPSHAGSAMRGSAAVGGDTTPKHDLHPVSSHTGSLSGLAPRASFDSGYPPSIHPRPSTSHSLTPSIASNSGYVGPLGPVNR